MNEDENIKNDLAKFAQEMGEEVIADAELPYLICANTIEPVQPRWLFRSSKNPHAGYIPAGSLVLCIAETEMGKTTLWLKIAAQLSRGLLPGEEFGKCGATVFLSTEDDANSVLVPRFLAMGGDIDLLHVQNPQTTGFSAVECMAVQPKLIVLDPVSAFIDLPPSNENGENSTRKELMRFVRMALFSGVTIVMIRHPHKSPQVGMTLHGWAMGSRAYGDLARATLFVFEDKTRTDCKGRMLYSLSNLCAEQQGLAFHLHEVPFTYSDGEGVTSIAVWDDEVYLPLSVKQAFATQLPERETPAQDAFAAFLIEHKGETFKTIDEIKKACGIGVNKVKNGLDSAGITKGEDGLFHL